jgi:branched-chain amino acid transport system substrate-binding protein
MTKMPLAEHDNVVKTFPPLVGIYESILSRGAIGKAPPHGLCIARTFVQVLKQCGDNLARENLMKQAANLKGVELENAVAGYHRYPPRGLLSAQTVADDML